MRPRSQGLVATLRGGAGQVLVPIGASGYLEYVARDRTRRQVATDTGATVAAGGVPRTLRSGAIAGAARVATASTLPAAPATRIVSGGAAVGGAVVVVPGVRSAGG